MAGSDYYIEDNSDIENKKLEAAKNLYRDGKYSGALNIYLDMVNASYSYKLYYEIGRCYYKMSDFFKAESNFLRSVELERRKNPSYLYLGNIAYKKQDLAHAIEYWIQAYSFKPDDESVCLNLAAAYFSKNMRFQSVFYYQKYLKYAKDKKTDYYKEIKKSIDEFTKMGDEFYRKALRAVSVKDNETAIKGLAQAAKSYPTSFDINFLLGKLYYEEKDYMHALVYLKQAYCLDSKSFDVLEKLPFVMLELGDYTAAYCCMKRLLPLVLNNQSEYLRITKALKELSSGFNTLSYAGHKDWAEKYYKDNNYHLALYEYENCVIINPDLTNEFGSIIQTLKSFINPEERIVKTCLEKGGEFYSNRDYKQANKYFSKVMTLTTEDTSEYRFAKSRLVNI